MNSLITICLILLSFNAIAQSSRNDLKAERDTHVKIRICTPSRSKFLPKPLIVIVADHKKLIARYDSAAFSGINVDWIRSVNVSRDSTLMKEYEADSKGGILTIELNGEKYPNAFDMVVKAMKGQVLREIKAP